APTSTPRRRMRPGTPTRRGIRPGTGTCSRFRSSTRGPLDADDRVARADARRARLRHTHAHGAQGKSLDERIGDGAGKGFDQVEVAAGRDLAHAVGDLPVVDGVLDPVRRARVAHVHADVVEELLAVAALLLQHAVAAEDGEALELEDHRGT